MKNNIILLILLCYSIVGFSQKEEQRYLLEADSSWFKEIIKFPISFAPEIAFKGVEELRFPPGWAKQESGEFWSYVWVWKLNDIETLTEQQLETNINYYFNGLLNIGNANSEYETKAFFIKTKTENNSIEYLGKVNTFDTRYAQKPMTLYAEVERNYCKKESSVVLLFRFSPKHYDDLVWDTLKTVKLKNDACEN